MNDDDGDEDDDAGFWVTLTHFTELGLEIDFHANKETKRNDITRRRRRRPSSFEFENPKWRGRQREIGRIC